VITYQLEKFVDSYPEAVVLLQRHWEEVALDKDCIKLDADIETYTKLEEQGILHILTVREDGILIGYHCSFVRPHLHYATSLTAFVDIYFIAPEKRNMPRVAMRMFKEVEKTLKARGVQRIITTTKLHLDKSDFLKFLGYTEVERVHSKIL
jgi:hypothetical protein